MRNILQPGEHVDMVLVMYDAPSVAAGAFRGGPDDRPGAIAAAKLRPRRRKLALAVTTGGTVLVARLTKLRGPELVQRFDSTAAVGATHVAATDSYVEVAGRRYSVHGVWTYRLFRLQSGLAAPVLPT